MRCALCNWGHDCCQAFSWKWPELGDICVYHTKAHTLSSLIFLYLYLPNTIRLYQSLQLECSPQNLFWSFPLSICNSRFHHWEIWLLLASIYLLIWLIPVFPVPTPADPLTMTRMPIHLSSLQVCTPALIDAKGLMAFRLNYSERKTGRGLMPFHGCIILCSVGIP